MVQELIIAKINHPDIGSRGRDASANRNEHQSAQQNNRQTCRNLPFHPSGRNQWQQAFRKIIIDEQRINKECDNLLDE